MLPVLEECWNRVQDTLRARAGDAVYKAWLAELRPVLMERGTVHLEAASRLAADRVRTLYRPLLQEVLSADFGIQLLVEVQSRDDDRIEALEVSPMHPVVDDGNRTAHLVLKSLGDQRSLPSNRFFFHGPAGVGKTFLLRWWRQTVRGKPMWFTAPDLFKAFQAAHQEKRVDGLYEELVQERPLVLDEVHRIAGKHKYQQFLLRVLRGREGLVSATLLAARWHPHEIRDLDVSLATLFLAGFVTSIDAPGAAGRLRYLRALEGAPSRNGRAQVIETLAQDCRGSFPELRVAWAKSRQGTAPPKYLELIDPGRVFARVRDRVAERFAVEKDALVGKGQGRRLSKARKVLAMLCLQEGLSGGEVGRFLSGRTRAAVSYMVRSLQDELAGSAELRREVEGLL
ncbi:MAG: AAA family ATPase [Planctomycetes bacterium]|nr:AAA family ATPase [Planctomycetota bacterium]